MPRETFVSAMTTQKLSLIEYEVYYDDGAHKPIGVRLIRNEQRISSLAGCLMHCRCRFICIRAAAICLLGIVHRKPTEKSELLFMVEL